jgi:heat shock protein HspQ
LNELAEEILRLKSSTFYKLVEEGGLGTDDALYISERQLSDQ